MNELSEPDYVGELRRNVIPVELRKEVLRCLLASRN